MLCIHLIVVHVIAIEKPQNEYDYDDEDEHDDGKVFVTTTDASANASRTGTWALSLAGAFRAMTRRPELLLFILLMALCNVPVLLGASCARLMFEPEAVRGGEWWRLLTHPFVHVTWYHLLLDGTAFVTLYYSLLEPALFRRLAYLFAAAAGSLLFSWAGAISSKGLCGLSGIAHGLMAVSALELVAHHPPGSPERRVGLAAFIFVAGKAAFEALTGRMFFAFLDFGLLGAPVAVSHAGGIIGGLLAMLLFARSPGYPPSTTVPPSKGGGSRRVPSGETLTFFPFTVARRMEPGPLICRRSRPCRKRRSAQTGGLPG